MAKKVSRFRMTLGWMMLVVALAAVAIYAFRPIHTRIIDVKVGTGPVVKPGDTVLVHYVGQLTNGKVFDSSKARGVPVDFPIGRGMVIQGWDRGIVGMQPGGVRQLIIPPEEGYGAIGQTGLIPPNSTLQFEVELISIR